MPLHVAVFVPQRVDLTAMFVGKFADSGKLGKTGSNLARPKHKPLASRMYRPSSSERRVRMSPARSTSRWLRACIVPPRLCDQPSWDRPKSAGGFRVFLLTASRQPNAAMQPRLESAGAGSHAASSRYGRPGKVPGDCRAPTDRRHASTGQRDQLPADRPARTQHTASRRARRRSGERRPNGGRSGGCGRRLMSSSAIFGIPRALPAGVKKPFVCRAFRSWITKLLAPDLWLQTINLIHLE